MIVFLTLVYCGILFALVKFKVVPFNLFWKALAGAVDDPAVHLSFHSDAMGCSVGNG